MKRTRIYGVWSSMRDRCNNPSNPAYKDYGGRGITVCARWSKFSNFLADMGEPPVGMTIERIFNDGGYCKDNCEWASRATQARNNRRNVLITIDGITRPLVDHADLYGIPYKTAYARLKNGWPAEKAVKMPIITNRKGIKRGETFHRRWSDPKAAEDAA